MERLSSIVNDASEQSVAVPLGERSYDILIRPGLLSEIGPRLRRLGLSGKAAVVTDPTVGRWYARPAIRSLDAAGFDVRTILAPAGEQAKSLRWLSKILDELAKARFERSSVLVALGGGVIGDLAGFAAAVYVRGIPFVQVPTTLVAQVDSSVGGKTGINLPFGKNLVGAFYQPRLVLIDPETLKTLPRRQWLAGLAEVIKYGMIADEAFFAYLEEHMDDLLALRQEAVMQVIRRSCEIKAGVVAEDERESDRRRILNYGHTVGHAMEALGKYRALLHGEAVAIGMAQESELACHLGICHPEVVARQRTLIHRACLPDSLPRVTAAALWDAMQYDKKVARGQVYCVLPEKVGQVRVEPIARSAFFAWFKSRGKGTKGA